MKQWRSLLLGIVFSLATLTLALWGNDLSKVGDELARGNYWWALVGFAFMIAGLITRAYRWRTLLNDKIEINRSFNIMNIGYFLGVILPFRLGEVARAYLTTRLDPPISMFTSLSSIVAERLVDLLTVIILLAAAFSLLPLPSNLDPLAVLNIERIILTSAVIAGVGLVVLVLFAVRRKLAHQLIDILLKIAPFLERFHIRDLAERLLDGVAPLGTLRSAFSVLGWTAISWFTSLAAGYTLMLTFYQDATWFATFLIIGMASFAVAIPAAPGNVGPFEAAIVYAMATAGFVEKEKAFAFALLIHAANVLSYVACGMVGLSREKLSFGELIQRLRQVRQTSTELTPANEPEPSQGTTK